MSEVILINNHCDEEDVPYGLFGFVPWDYDPLESNEIYCVEVF